MLRKAQEGHDRRSGAGELRHDAAVPGSCHRRRLARAPRRRARRCGASRRTTPTPIARSPAEASRAQLDPRERAFATQLVYGAVQRRRTLDHVIEALARGPVGQQRRPGARRAAASAACSCCSSTASRPHAAVDQSVELVKSAAGSAARGAGLVNAVLRRAAREGSGLIASLDDTTPRGAALRHSVPDWLATMWWDTLGAADARALLARMNEPAEASLRVNTLVATPAEVLAQLTARGVPVRPAAGALDGDRQTIGESSPAHAGAAAADASLPEGLLLDGAFAVTADPLWASGALVAQSRAAMHAARLLAPAPGMRVLDLCAAPRRQGDPPRGAARGQRRDRRRGARSGPRRARCGRRARACTPPACSVEVGDASDAARGRALRRGARRPALLGASGRCRAGRTCAGG